MVPHENFGNYVDTFSVQHRALYDVRRVLLSVGHASLVMLIFRSRVVPWLMKALANVGSNGFYQLPDAIYHLYPVFLWLWFRVLK
jgi:predicted Kef-type K+ transport protein